MNILVTGATGFVGRRLVTSLGQRGELSCVARSEDTLNAQPDINWIVQDLSQNIEPSAFPSKLDVIIHLVQSRHFREFPEKALDVFNVNVASTMQLLDYGRNIGIKQFILASTGGVYAFKDSTIYETDCPDPPNFYGYSKYLSECLVNSYSENFSTVILRYFFVYGEGQQAMFIPNMIGSVKQGNPIMIQNERGRRINPIYVGDAVDATVNALNLEGHEVINVAGGEIVTIKEIARLIGQMLEIEPKYTLRSERGPIDMVADISSMTLKLGITGQVPLEEGLRRTIAAT